MADIRIEIDTYTGKISVEGMGYKGGQCLKDIGELENLIGFRTISQKAKPELQRQVRVQKLRR